MPSSRVPFPFLLGTTLLWITTLAAAAPSSVRLLPPERLAAVHEDRYLFDTWSSDNGLPQNTVNAIVQTRDGFLWLATFAGLVRFDGHDFRTFTSNDTPALTSNRILSLYEDRSGALWIGSERDGVYVLREGRVARPEWDDHLPGREVWDFDEGSDGALWIATGGGAARVDRNGHVTPFIVGTGAHRRSTRAIATAADGSVRIGTLGSGIARIIAGHVDVRTPREVSDTDRVNTIATDSSGGVWLGTQAGLYRLDGDRATHVALPGRANTAPVRAIAADGESLWIGTNEGLCHRHAGFTRCYDRSSGLSDAFVRALTYDREGNLWVGTNAGGVVRVKRRAAMMYRPRTQPDTRVSFLPIVEDGADGLWAGSLCGGLLHLRRDAFERYGRAQGLPHDCVTALDRDSDALWIGTGGGLGRLAQRQLTWFTDADGLARSAVTALARDSTGALWIGTYGAITRLAGSAFSIHRLPLESATVSFLSSARSGGLWLGTTAGLFRFQNDTFTRWSTVNGLSHDTVRVVLEDPDGTLWIGTYGGGLNRLKDGHVTRYTTDNGLGDNVVSWILDDGRGSFWLTGNRGVFRVARDELDAVASRRAKVLTSVAYGTSDGMRTAETNGGGQPAGWRSTDGRLWFPTVNGLVAFDPAAPTNTQPPPVRVTQVVVDRQATDPPAELVVPAAAHTVEIHYAGLSFVAPQKVRFQYKLDGYDRDWIDAGARRTAYYTELPPGTYRFHLRARNDDGVWSLDRVALQVRQLPSVYQTGWFAASSLLLLVAVVIAGHRWRLRRIVRRAMLLERDVASRTAEAVERSNQLADTHDRLATTHRQLEHAHDDLLAILDHLRVGVALLDAGGLVVFLSTAARTMLGLTAAETIGRSWSALLPVKDEDRRQIQTLVAQPPEQRARVPICLELDSGRQFWLEVDVRPDPGDESRRILYMYDVTEVYDLQRFVSDLTQFEGLVGRSRVMQIVYKQIRDLATLESTVLVEGETGTGKELVARAIHRLSARTAGPFVAINCASLAESLLASQLFGHRRGAFTGAVTDQMGLFEAAHGGTLFLDEIGDMALSVQAHLLRVLQEMEILRVGESRPRKIDVRVIAATHRDLRAEVDAGRFRADLFYRIRVMHVRLPALRERRDDIPLLVAWFLRQHRVAGRTPVRDVSRDAMSMLLAHRWTGNVRELKIVTESAALTASGPVIEFAHLPAEMLASAVGAPTASTGTLDPRDSGHVRLALQRTYGNRAAAARLLGISRSTLYRRIEELEIELGEAEGA